MTIIRTLLCFNLAVLLYHPVLSQETNQSFKKSIKMDKNNSKEVIIFLYDSILNKQQFERLSEVVSPDYTNPFGVIGVEGFGNSILELAKAFPDANWKLLDIVSEGNKLVVKQNFTGTQTKQFQNIPPTGKFVSVDGIATYELQNGKIISSQIQTDRLAFMQGLGIIPQNLTPTNKNTIYFIDKFFIPRLSIKEFKKQMNYTREFITKLNGYIKEEIFEQYDNEGNLNIITIAVWKSLEELNEAKQAVQTEFLRTAFNPAEFFQKLNVKIERGQYISTKE